VPLLAWFVIGAGAATYLAARSPALPLAVWTASLLPELVLHGRLPKGATVAGFAAWTALGLAIAVARRDRPRPSLAVAVDLPGAALAGLVALLLVRLPSSQDASYGNSKVELFLAVCVLTFVVGVLVGYVRSDLLLFIAVSAGMTLAAAIYDVVLLGNGGIDSPATNRLALSSWFDPIGFARSMGELALILLFAAARARTPARRTFFVLALLPTAVAFLGTGSRGPLLGLVVAVPAMLLWMFGNKRMAKRVVITVAIALVGATVLSSAGFIPGQSVDRALSVFTGSELPGETPRSVLWNEATHQISSSWQNAAFGIGTGSFAAVDIYGERYPHNIVLETWAELGILGLGLLVLAIGASLYRLGGLTLRGGDAGALAGLLFALIVYSVVNALVSGDLAGNSAIWLYMGLGSGLVMASSSALRGRVPTRRQVSSPPPAPLAGRA
jgi:O-antigen ligase